MVSKKLKASTMGIDALPCCFKDSYVAEGTDLALSLLKKKALSRLTAFSSHQRLSESKITNNLPEHCLQRVGEIHRTSFLCEFVYLGHGHVNVQFLDRLLPCERLRSESLLDHFMQPLVELWIGYRDKRRGVQNKV